MFADVVVVSETGCCAPLGDFALRAKPGESHAATMHATKQRPKRPELSCLRMRRIGAASPPPGQVFARCANELRMDVTVLLEPAIDLPRLAEVLDGLGHEGRVHTVRGWGRKTQAALFEAAR